MSDSQVVDADHNDRVQDNDLAKEHDFFIGTLGAEEMPTVRGVYDMFNTALLSSSLGYLLPITGSHGEMVTTRFDHVQYIPLLSREFGSVETEIRDDTGRPVPFEHP